jgi:hypothetical protein
MQQQPLQGQEEEESPREDAMDSEEAIGEVQWTEEERIARAKAGPGDRTEESNKRRSGGTKGVPRKKERRAAGEVEEPPSEELMREARRIIRKVDQLERAFKTGQRKLTAELQDMIQEIVADDQAREARDQGTAEADRDWQETQEGKTTMPRRGFTPPPAGQTATEKLAPLGWGSRAVPLYKTREWSGSMRIQSRTWIRTRTLIQVYAARTSSPWRATRSHPPAAESSHGVVCRLRRAARGCPPAVESSQGPSAGC